MPTTDTDRLSNLLAAYVSGRLELETCVAELTHVYVEQGWSFYLLEEECEPEHLDCMRALAERMDACASAFAGTH
jgi:hypothetical protein